MRGSIRCLSKEDAGGLSGFDQLRQTRGRGRHLLAVLTLFAENRQEVRTDFPVLAASTVPLADDGRGCRVEPRYPVQPANAGVQRQVSGARMVPSDMGRQA